MEKTVLEIKEKWKSVVDFSSKTLDETPEDHKTYVSLMLEEWETKILKWVDDGKVNSLFIKYLIPQVRSSLGYPNIELDVEIDGRRCVVVNNGKLYKYIGKLGIPYNPEKNAIGCNRWIDDDVYYFINDQWVPCWKYDNN
jgi:hypothetical protein